MDINETRTLNFLAILRQKYGDSPKAFEYATGYSANMVSQIKTRKKNVNDRLARKLETLMKCEPLLLDKQDAQFIAEARPKYAPWPLSVPQDKFDALNPRVRREIDEAFTKMVIGAQAQELTQRPRITRQSKVMGESVQKKRRAHV